MQNNTHLALTEQNETIALRTKAPVTPHLTAMPQRLYIVQKTCQRAVESPRNTPKISNLPVMACTQRPYSIYGAQAVAAACSRRAHSVLTARTAFSR